MRNRDVAVAEAPTLPFLMNSVRAFLAASGLTGPPHANAEVNKLGLVTGKFGHEREPAVIVLSRNTKLIPTPHPRRPANPSYPFHPLHLIRVGRLLYDERLHK